MLFAVYFSLLQFLIRSEEFYLPNDISFVVSQWRASGYLYCGFEAVTLLVLRLLSATPGAAMDGSVLSL